MDISTGLVTERKVAINRDGNKAGRLLQVLLTDIRDVQTVQLVGQTGEESNPPNGSLVAVLAESEGMKVAVATADGILPDLGIGGKRIYSTDQTGTVRKADVRLDPDGKITVTGPVAKETLFIDGKVLIENANANIEILANGKITIDGPVAKETLAVDGTVTIENANGSVTLLPTGQIAVVNGSGSITISPAGVITFHGTSATFDCPVTAPAFTATTANGGSGEINAKKVTATEDVLANGISGATHQHTETGIITFGPQ